MKWKLLDQEDCSIARTVAVIGDRWNLLILREAFRRAHRFEEFQTRLGINRHLLSKRLKRFMEYDVLERRTYRNGATRQEYVLTERGLDLYPVLMTILHWGDVHMIDERGRPKLHRHRNCGKFFDPMLICSECKTSIFSHDVSEITADARNPRRDERRQ